MIITAKVHASSKRNEVIQKEDSLEIYTTAKPTDGQANKAIIKILADYFNKPKTLITIEKGQTSHIKTIKIVE